MAPEYLTATHWRHGYKDAACPALSSAAEAQLTALGRAPAAERHDPPPGSAPADAAAAPGPRERRPTSGGAAPDKRPPSGLRPPAQAPTTKELWQRTSVPLGDARQRPEERFVTEAGSKFTFLTKAEEDKVGIRARALQNRETNIDQFARPRESPADWRSAQQAAWESHAREKEAHLRAVAARRAEPLTMPAQQTNIDFGWGRPEVGLLPAQKASPLQRSGSEALLTPQKPPSEVERYVPLNRLTNVDFANGNAELHRAGHWLSCKQAAELQVQRGRLAQSRSHSSLPAADDPRRSTIQLGGNHKPVYVAESRTIGAAQTRAGLQGRIPGVALKAEGDKGFRNTAGQRPPMSNQWTPWNA